MITFDILCARFATLHPDDLQRWIVEGYVQSEAAEGELRFQDIDAERVRLIVELRDVLEVNEAALPVVLSLLDQVYGLRRRLRELGAQPDDAGES